MIALVVEKTSGLVVNAVVVDDDSSFQIEGCDILERPDKPEGVWIGWVRAGKTWTPPAITADDLSED